MFITLEELENSPNGSVHVDFCEKLKDITSEKEIIASLDFEQKGACVEVAGTLDAVVELECDRCLKKFNYRINVDIQEVFTTVDAVDYSHNEIELKNDNFVVELGKDGEIDVTDFVYQTVLLNLPSKKICDKNCKGSEVLQEMQKQNIDPRLAVFKDIKIK